MMAGAKMKREPVIIAAAVVALIEATIIAAVAFGWGINPDQQAALMGVIIAAAAVIAPLVGAIWARSKVTPVSDPKDDAGYLLVPDLNHGPRQ